MSSSDETLSTYVELPQEEQDNNIQPLPLPRRSARVSVVPDRLLDRLLHTSSIQEFYYEDVPSDLEECELECSSDEEWVAQQEEDELEEYEPLPSSDDSIYQFIVDPIASDDDDGRDGDVDEAWEVTDVVSD